MQERQVTVDDCGRAIAANWLIDVIDGAWRRVSPAPEAGELERSIISTDPGMVHAGERAVT